MGVAPWLIIVALGLCVCGLMLRWQVLARGLEIWMRKLRTRKRFTIYALTGRMIYSARCYTFKECVEQAIARNVDLSGADLMRQDLTELKAVGARLAGAYFSHSILSDADFTRADLRQASLRHVLAGEADFTAAVMAYASCEYGNFSYAVFDDADLTMTIFTHAIMSHTQLLLTDTTHMQLYGARLGATERRASQFEIEQLVHYRDALFGLFMDVPELPARIRYYMALPQPVEDAQRFRMSSLYSFVRELLPQHNWTRTIDLVPQRFALLADWFGQFEVDQDNPTILRETSWHRTQIWVSQWLSFTTLRPAPDPGTLQQTLPSVRNLRVPGKEEDTSNVRNQDLAAGG